MKGVLWTIGKVLELTGLIMVTIGLFMGIGQGNLGLEYAAAALGLAVFLLGRGVRALAGK